GISASDSDALFAPVSRRQGADDLEDVESFLASLGADDAPPDDLADMDDLAITGGNFDLDALFADNRLEEIDYDTDMKAQRPQLGEDAPDWLTDLSEQNT